MRLSIIRGEQSHYVTDRDTEAHRHGSLKGDGTISDALGNHGDY